MAKKLNEVGNLSPKKKKDRMTLHEFMFLVFVLVETVVGFGFITLE